ncbi:type II toxin-antitoxin system Phd/YefM family antitoxin [Candidatus Poriferisodalis sp.]|uniref:type II toxin-antitoxin system Phd/YefM family antitoxin n=1 Tax=Candidatus Poriferisodalis sp. TaxID=3101277 RepID=UPI003B0173A3
MKSVGIREFRDRATQLIASGETLVVEKHGEPVGFFVPIVARDRRAGAAALDRLGETVKGVLARTGLTEDDLVAEFTGAVLADEAGESEDETFLISSQTIATSDASSPQHASGR